MYAPNQPYGGGGYQPVMVQPGMPGHPPPAMGQPVPVGSVMVRKSVQINPEERFVRRPMMVEFGSIVSVAESASGMDENVHGQKEQTNRCPVDCEREKNARSTYDRARFVIRFLEDKMFDLGRQLHFRQGKASIRRMLRFIPGVRKSAKAKGYEHLITDEER
uniref:Uncharacterized protein n=1 Tax=Anopheles maculatus TaxID=74869 RepID=A0A182SGH9_9DIPT